MKGKIIWLIICLCSNVLLFAEEGTMADVYLESLTPQHICGAEVIKGYPFRGNEKVLNFGCGNGTLTTLMAKQLPQGKVLAIDSSPIVIERAKATWGDSLPNVTFEVLDAENMRFSEEFDLVTAFFSLERILDPAKALKNFEAWLVPGGKILVLSPYEQADAFRSALNKTILSKSWAHYFEDFIFSKPFSTIDEFSNLLENLCLTITSARIRSKNLVFSSKIAFQKTIASSLMHSDPIPMELKDAFLAEVVNEYLYQMPPDKFDRILYSLHMIEVLAEKSCSEKAGVNALGKI